MTQSSACATRRVFLRSMFTGKERDTESGNDYFGARYYSSAMGRFMSPDWSAQEEPVPYAKLENPQSLNLYSYVQNNPFARIDADGHNWMENEISGAFRDFDAQIVAQQAAAQKAAAQQQGNSQQDSVADTRNQIAKAAQGVAGKTDWSYNTKPCGWKCSKFVHDVIGMVGIGGSGQPTASQLADPNYHMKGWTDAQPGATTLLHPGDIVAYKIAHPEPGATGDSGIITRIDKSGAYVTAAGYHSVYTESILKWSTQNGNTLGDFMVRSYVGQ